ncbi:MAG: SGNH/GDSL hydrolase family protein [Pseudomarimonas sp.]
MSNSQLRAIALNCATAALAPLLLLQGRRVRRRTPKLAEPPGARRGESFDGRPLRLLILGDSAAAGVGASSQVNALSGQLVARLSPQHALHWQLLAETGRRARDGLLALQREPSLRCDVALTSLGVNDVTALASARQFHVDMQAVIMRLREHAGARLILLSGLPPMGEFPALPQPLRWRLGQQARLLDQVLRRLAATHADCRHLPFGPLPSAALLASDGFHPGPQAYALWAESAVQQIARWQQIEGSASGRP